MKLAYKNNCLANVYQRTLKNKVERVLVTSVSQRGNEEDGEEQGIESLTDLCFPELKKRS